MQYNQVLFKCDPYSETVTDILSAMLAEIGFESFVRGEDALEAYVPQPLFSRSELDQVLADLPLEVEISYTVQTMEDKNWNEEWEKNYFNPIVIGDECCIHSSFHQPEGTYRYPILIDPKMSFGTGHHQTTLLILKEILAMELSGKCVLDMGCGTGVLAILAAMKGAAPVTAIDIEEWAYNNAMENVVLNGMTSIRVLQGGAELLGEERYDVIFANINRNILLQDLPHYEAVLKQGGIIVMSGFYLDDLPAIRSRANELGLSFDHLKDMDRWVATTFVKM
ncbi:MAG: 50S ribosomal protein L11 methyltransferase [Bacteroidales bacterium]|jgi:ribosomal protein L11 methyltransferase|nr:50S ribosomal protein L11 methyltransferase [Bacteroidales bacterium]